MTQSFWQHKPFSLEWDASTAGETLFVQLASQWNLRKVLVHNCKIHGTANIIDMANQWGVPFVEYWLDWYGYSMDVRRIFQATYALPTVSNTYRPPGGASDAFFRIYSGGDREVGFNQTYNYKQGEGFGFGTLQFHRIIANGFDVAQSSPGFFSGILSVLGQHS